VHAQEGADLEAAKQQLRERHGIHVWVSPLSSTRIDMESRGLQVQRNSAVMVTEDLRDPELKTLHCMEVHDHVMFTTYLAYNSRSIFTTVTVLCACGCRPASGRPCTGTTPSRRLTSSWLLRAHCERRRLHLVPSSRHREAVQTLPAVSHIAIGRAAFVLSADLTSACFDTSSSSYHSIG
jgi:hypothetical protein